ncbi:hypothetical protein [Clostridium butyricum]|uniref:hypothetical protein n=1 Tax=Clostridium butyricum TaxID=1492 RepID=UPI00168B20B1|nr:MULTISPECIES: hypothetical protein [Clostridium]MBS5984088.1 hypothetical protein [Clostridium butyricum]MDB2152306.1 hypothetical protein [Clostridium butyricum]
MKLESKKKYMKEFYANFLYSKNVKGEGKAHFVKKTKQLIEEGRYLDAIENLKILYYEKGLGIKVDNYYSTKIDINKINCESLNNQRLLLEDFFGKYSGISSKRYSETMIAIPSAIFAGIAIEGIKDTLFDSKYINIIFSLIGGVFLYIVIFSLIMSFARKMYRSLKKEKFYALCLESINQLISEFDKNNSN